MRLLVTGASGYLGAEVAARGGPHVAGTYLTRHPGDVPWDVAQLDVRDFDAVEGLVSSFAPDVIVHTAYVQGGPEARRTIVDGSAAIAASAAAHYVRLIHLSTDLVFSGLAGRPYTEDDRPDPIVEYGRFKLAAERTVGPEALIVRTSLLYGAPTPGPQERMALDPKVNFFRDELRCPTAVCDLAGALIELAATDVTGPLHVAAPEGLSRYDFARLLARRHGHEPAAAERTAAEAGRPTDCRLDSSRAESLLSTRIRGVSEVLARE